MNTATLYKHVVLNDAGVPIVEGTTTKVIEIVLDVKAYGWSPEEIHFQHPYLSLGQIHSALAYYWDHQEKLDTDIERRLLQAEEIRGQLQPVPLLAKLRAKGLIK
ncbi:MAG: DUF433 domain-containing protein [Anaerolineae bacterium]|nr:DUF433 domain-containing protein [Anaerolineae bacterium]